MYFNQSQSKVEQTKIVCVEMKIFFLYLSSIHNSASQPLLNRNESANVQIAGHIIGNTRWTHLGKIFIQLEDSEVYSSFRLATPYGF